MYEARLGLGCRLASNGPIADCLLPEHYRIEQTILYWRMGLLQIGICANPVKMREHRATLTYPRRLLDRILHKNILGGWHSEHLT